MIRKDKELMEMHLNAIRKAVYSLNDDVDLQFSRELNLKLINLRERIRKRVNDQLDGL